MQPPAFTDHLYSHCNNPGIFPKRPCAILPARPANHFLAGSITSRRLTNARHSSHILSLPGEHGPTGFWSPYPLSVPTMMLARLARASLGDGEAPLVLRTASLLHGHNNKQIPSHENGAFLGKLEKEAKEVACSEIRKWAPARGGMTMCWPKRSGGSRKGGRRWDDERS